MGTDGSTKQYVQFRLDRLTHQVSKGRRYNREDRQAINWLEDRVAGLGEVVASMMQTIAQMRNETTAVVNAEEEERSHVSTAE